MWEPTYDHQLQSDIAPKQTSRGPEASPLPSAALPHAVSGRLAGCSVERAAGADRRLGLDLRTPSAAPVRGGAAAPNATGPRDSGYQVGLVQNGELLARTCGGKERSHAAVFSAHAVG